MVGTTKRQFSTLEDLFSYYNDELFKGSLPFCLITLARRRGAAGYFVANSWNSADGQTKHEISINPDTLHVGDEYWHSTLVHEMCHMWQSEYGTPSRYSYHNKEWANKMYEVGLMPSDTGQPGGKTTGQHMSDYVLNTGRFRRAFQAINLNELDGLRLPYTATVRKGKLAAGQMNNGSKGRSGVKVKYSCLCGTNVWGKSELHIRCLRCNSDFLEQ